MFLSLAQSDSVSAYHGAEPHGQTHDEFFYIGYLYGAQQSFSIYVSVVYGDVSGNGFGEYHSVLHYYPALSAPPFQVEAVQVGFSYFYFSLHYRIIPQQQFQQGGFSTARSTHYGSHFRFGDGEAYIFYGHFRAVGVIFEADMLKRKVIGDTGYFVQ